LNEANWVRRYAPEPSRPGQRHERRPSGGSRTRQYRPVPPYADTVPDLRFIEDRLDELTIPLLVPLRTSKTLDGETFADVLALGDELIEAVSTEVAVPVSLVGQGVVHLHGHAYGGGARHSTGANRRRCLAVAGAVAASVRSEVLTCREVPDGQGPRSSDRGKGVTATSLQADHTSLPAWSNWTW